MALQLIGAGAGRTGTRSLKLALETLLGGQCYHMVEVLCRPEHVAPWHAAIACEPTDWHFLFEDYEAAVDWPAAAFWREISDAFPDALVLLSVRPAADWWRSASTTIFRQVQSERPPEARLGPWQAMVLDLFTRRFTAGWTEERAAKAAYEQHNAAVRAEIAPERLVEWNLGDGWEPLCRALGRPVPDHPFPVTNTTEEYLALMKSR